MNRIIKIIKLDELPNAKHPFNKEIGYEKEGEFIAEPEIGNCFYIGLNWRTSIVTEIIDKNTFKTLNSIYTYI